MNPAVLPIRRSASRRFPFAGKRTVVLIWLVLALALLVFDWPAITALRATDPDDYMRLLEVRDWLGGQGWSDVRQYRMDPPAGADMHWSRLVDLPIAALLVPARLILAEPAASAVAMALVPLLQLLVAMLLLHRLMRALGAGEGPALTAAAIPLLFPLLTSNFMPMRIDHHGWQAVCALGCVLALRRTDGNGPALAGAIAGLWLTISLEGLVLVGALAGLMGWRALRQRDTALVPFCAALAMTGTGLGIATRPLAALAHATADQLSWPHLLAFGALGLVAALASRLPGWRHPAGRFAALALAGLAGAAVMLGGLGLTALDPFHGLDPVVRQLWLDNVTEGLDLTRQDWSTRAMLVWTPLLVLAGWRLVPRDGRQTRAWDELALLALVASALSLLLLSGAIDAQLLTVQFSALLLARWFPRAQALRTAAGRVLAMLACLTGLTPCLASAGGRLLDMHRYPIAAAPLAGISRAAPMAGPASCDPGRLAALPPAHLFALLDLGPEILVRSGHTVVAGSYHRNSARMRDVIEAFSGDPARARALVIANHAGTVVFCTSDDEARIDAGRRPDNLANALQAGHPPPWLQPVPEFSGALQVYRVR